MNAVKHPISLPLLSASLAALLLLLSAAALLLNVLNESNTADTRATSVELVDSVEQLAGVVRTDSTEWVYGDQVAQLIASVDVQIDQLEQSSHGFFAFFWSDVKFDAVRSVSADWQLMREGLLSFTQTAQKTPQPETTSSNQQPGFDRATERVAAPAAIPAAIPAALENQVAVIAVSFESIRASVIEGTRDQSLIDLVNVISNNWVQVSASNPESFYRIVEQQKANANELLRLSGAGTEQSLFGYYTSNQISDYVQSTVSIKVPEQAIHVADVKTVQFEKPQANKAAPLSNAFVVQALAPLIESTGTLRDITHSEAGAINVLNWAGLAGLLTSLLLLLLAISKMMHAADWLKGRSAQLSESAPMPGRGAMSLREADELIEDINTVAAGDLRQQIRLPQSSHAKAIAKSANRSGAVISDLVAMLRGVASHLNALVQRQDQHSRVLAGLDIRRQTVTAELSDDISSRSILLDKQRLLLSNSGDLLTELTDRSESTVIGAGQVSSSLAAVSAQVEVGVERMQRLMKTAGSVTEATAKLKQLTEKTRLQTLNVSLKMPQVTRETASVYSEFETYSESGGGSSIGAGSVESGLYDYSPEADGSADEEVIGMFDDIHQLTGQMVQVSNEADVLIGALRKEIDDTATALKQSSQHMNESAHHTHSASLLGKELGGYSDQLRTGIDEALKNLQVLQSDLSQTAERLVRLDKTGNDTSELTLALTQDLAGLEEMSAKIEESVSGFKISGEGPLE